MNSAVCPDRGTRAPARRGRRSARRDRTRKTARVLLIGSPSNRAHLPLLSAWTEMGIEVALLSGTELRLALGGGDVVIGRLDVLPTLDGVEAGLFDLLLVEHAGVRVVNSARSLVAAHDKLVTARRLARAGLPHPRTELGRSGKASSLRPPVVVKPRFGSWGKDVFRCETRAELARVLRAVSDRSWYRRHGALVQELVPTSGVDLRLVIAGGTVIGAVERIAAPGEWRTNVALGGSVRSVDPPPQACALALAAAAALGCDFVGVDLLPVGPAGFVVLELNGAVEFREPYSLAGRSLYEDLARALRLQAGRA